MNDIENMNIFELREEIKKLESSKDKFNQFNLMRLNKIKTRIKEIENQFEEELRKKKIQKEKIENESLFKHILGKIIYFFKNIHILFFYNFVYSIKGYFLYLFIIFLFYIKFGDNNIVKIIFDGLSFFFFIHHIAFVVTQIYKLSKGP